MSRLTFRAWRGNHYLGLPEILCALGRVTAEAAWELKLDEVAPGPQGDDLQSMAESRVQTRDLILAAFPDGQIIDGELRAFASSGDTVPFLVLYAVDSSDWDVETEDTAVFAAVRDRFPEAAVVD